MFSIDFSADTVLIVNCKFSLVVLCQRVNLFAFSTDAVLVVDLKFSWVVPYCRGNLFAFSKKGSSLHKFSWTWQCSLLLVYVTLGSLFYRETCRIVTHPRPQTFASVWCWLTVRKVSCLCSMGAASSTHTRKNKKNVGTPWSGCWYHGIILRLLFRKSYSLKG